MIKDCTSVEQGRMLVALGISSSTADKCWIAMESSKDEPALYPAVTGTGQRKQNDGRPFPDGHSQEKQARCFNPCLVSDGTFGLAPFRDKGWG